MCHCKKTKKCKVVCAKVMSSLVDAGESRFEFSQRNRRINGRTVGLYKSSYGLDLGLGNAIKSPAYGLGADLG